MKQVFAQKLKRRLLKYINDLNIKLVDADGWKISLTKN